MILSNLVREARRRAGLTQVALALRAGVPQSTIARLESGSRVPSTKLVERLVRIAGFEIRCQLGQPDPGTRSLFEATLRQTPAERLAGAVRAARFVLGGRSRIGNRHDG